MNTKGHNRKNTVVLFHARCTDGLCAAYMAYRELGKKANYIPVEYNKPVPVEALQAKYIFMVDFCYALKEMKQLAENTHARDGYMVVLDHHEGQKETMRQLKKSSIYNGCEVIFNQNMSGAGLAFMYFIAGNTNDEVRKMTHHKFVDYFDVSNSALAYDKLYKLACMVQDRDLWKWKLEESRPFSFWYYQNKQDFKTLEAIVEGKVSLAVAFERGRQIMEYHDSIVQRHAEAARPIELMDVNGNLHKGLFCFCHDARLVSDIGNVLSRKTKTFGCVVGFSNSGPDFVVSLRSNKQKRYGNFDCIPVAKAYGGGGHRNASGCRFTPAQMQEATKLIQL